MCCNQQIIRNKKYIVNNTNNGDVPTMVHPREKYIMIDCGRCEECRKARARDWQIRLQEEIKNNKEQGYFITLTFEDKQWERLKEEYKKQEPKRNKNNIFRTKTKERIITESKYDQNIATFAVRRWLERWRKIHGKSLRHWLIMERGHKGTERIHLHGIIWQDLYEIQPTKDRKGKEWKSDDIISKTWRYGFVFTGHKCDTATARYITKYITKFDEREQPENFRILTTPGIGRGYLTEERIRDINNLPDDEQPQYREGPTGIGRPLPHYYYNVAIDKKKREKRFIEYLKRHKVNIGKVEYDFSTEKGIRAYWETKRKAREIDRSWNKPYRREIEKKGWKAKVVTAENAIAMLGKIIEEKTERIKESTEFNGAIYAWKKRKKLSKEKETQRPKYNEDWREVMHRNEIIKKKRRIDETKLVLIT